MVGAVRNGESAQIPQRFSQHLLPGVMLTAPNVESIELIDYTRGSRITFLAVFLRPPVVQGASCIIFRPAIVKLMAKLMTNHRTDRTVVRSIIRLHIEKRWLQNSRREHHLEFQ